MYSAFPVRPITHVAHACAHAATLNAALQGNPPAARQQQRSRVFHHQQRANVNLSSSAAVCASTVTFAHVSFTTTTTGSLLIRTVEDNDEGEYVCRAISSYGHVDQTLTLRVAGEFVTCNACGCVGGVWVCGGLGVWVITS